MAHIAMCHVVSCPFSILKPFWSYGALLSLSQMAPMLNRRSHIHGSLRVCHTYRGTPSTTLLQKPSQLAAQFFVRLGCYSTICANLFYYFQATVLILLSNTLEMKAIPLNKREKVSFLPYHDGL